MPLDGKARHDPGNARFVGLVKHCIGPAAHALAGRNDCPAAGARPSSVEPSGTALPLRASCIGGRVVCGIGDLGGAKSSVRCLPAGCFRLRHFVLCPADTRQQVAATGGGLATAEGQSRSGSVVGVAGHVLAGRSTHDACSGWISSGRCGTSATFGASAGRSTPCRAARRSAAHGGFGAAGAAGGDRPIDLAGRSGGASAHLDFTAIVDHLADAGTDPLYLVARAGAHSTGRLSGQPVSIVYRGAAVF